MKKGSILARGVICTLLGGTLWGFSSTCSQLLLTTYNIPVTYITWVRMMATGCLFVAMMLVHDRSKLADMVRDRSTVKGLILFALFGILLGQVGYALAIKYTDAGTATVLQSTGTVMLIAFACIVGRKAPKRIEVLATALAIGATFLIATQGDPAAMNIPAAGLVWGLVNGASSAFFAGYPHKLLQKWGSLPVMGCAMMIGGAVITPVAQPWAVHVQWDTISICAIASVVLLGTFASFALFLQGVKDLGGVKASLLGVIEPVSATVFAWALMGSHFSAIDLVGFAMMIAMVIIVTLQKPRLHVTDEQVVRQDTIRSDEDRSECIGVAGPQSALLQSGR